MQPVPPARHLLRAKDLVDARYRDPLDVAALASAARLSPAHFSREFRRAFGETPHQYLLTRRLERAAALLRNTDHTVADICFTVGCRASGRSPRASAARSALRPPPIAKRTRPQRPAHGSRPACCRRTRAPSPAVFEKTAARSVANVAADSSTTTEDDMLKQLTHTQVWVNDQDEALAFYTEKLGMELREDVTVPEMGNFRWLTVGVPGQPDVAITLMAVPGPPVFDEDTRDKIKTLLAKGAGGGLFFSTDDCQASYEELKKRGVEFAQEPTDQPYGLDAGFRDPSGNHFRLTERR
jgi:catechol 2,3-dioxygenase-like lactoylglutathione lyase family enzyme